MEIMITKNVTIILQGFVCGDTIKLAHLIQ